MVRRKKKRKNNKYWAHGELVLIALAADVSPQYLSDVVRKRRNVSIGRAMLLEEACRIATGKEITWDIWMQNQTIDHPAFR